MDFITETESVSCTARYRSLNINQVNVIKDVSFSGAWRLVLGKMDMNISLESLSPAFRWKRGWKEQVTANYRVSHQERQSGFSFYCFTFYENVTLKSMHMYTWKKDASNLTFKGPCIVIYSYNKSQRNALFFNFILVQKLYIFRTDLLSIIRSLNTVFTATGIRHIARRFSAYFVTPYCSVGLIQFFFGVLILICFFFASWALTKLKSTSCCEYIIKTRDGGQ